MGCGSRRGRLCGIPRRHQDRRAAGETHADNGLASGTEYRYAVSALAPSGAEGKPSSELLGKTTGSPPVVAPPTNLAAGAVTPNSVGLSWAAAAGAAGYDIFRGTGTGAPVRINPTRVPVTSYTAEGLTPSTTYSFTVKAYDTAGAASAPSNTVTIVTGALAACFMASNFAHVQAGRAHDRGGIAFANGSDERTEQPVLHHDAQADRLQFLCHRQPDLPLRGARRGSYVTRAWIDRPVRWLAGDLGMGGRRVPRAVLRARAPCTIS